MRKNEEAGSPYYRCFFIFPPMERGVTITRSIYYSVKTEEKYGQ
jgi:hypothetical protein